MSDNRKQAREIAGFTFDRVRSDPGSWMGRAIAFKDAAQLIASRDKYSPPVPYYYNCGLALELLLKAILVARGKEFEATHRLNYLCSFADIQISRNQECTLELLSEIIEWGGRYPVPKKEGRWNNYHDVIQEKHKIRTQSGNSGQILADKEKFPTLENFLKLWEFFEAKYEAVNGV